MTGKRALTFPIGKVGIDGTVTTSGSVTLLAGTANVGDVDVASLPSLATGSATIGKVDTTVATMTQGRDTNVVAATERTLSSAACTKGIWLCNANAAGTIYAGMTAATLSATLHLWRLLPGQSVFVPGITNADVIGWCTDTNGLNLDYGTI